MQDTRKRYLDIRNLVSRILLNADVTVGIFFALCRVLFRCVYSIYEKLHRTSCDCIQFILCKHQCPNKNLPLFFG